MPIICQRVSMQFTYPVHFTEGLFEPDNAVFANVVEPEQEPRRILPVVDAGVLQHHPDLPKAMANYVRGYPEIMRLVSDPVVVPGGEAVKNDARWVELLRRQVSELGICRHSYLIAIGGGAVLDMVGYAAATAHRGVRLVRVPTTVLSQNDSGVGVKNGINAYGKKNFLGTFAPPWAVLNDCRFLTTLDRRDWLAGTAEAVKVALIKDVEFFAYLEQVASALTRRSMEPMQQLIQRCAELHLEHIAGSGDPFERGSSRPLDFGHWAAHKLEQLSDFRLRHGEAVAIGIALDCTYSYLAGMLSEQAWQRVLCLLEALGFELFAPELAEGLAEPDDPRSIFGGLAEFREHLGGQLTLTLLNDLGSGVEVHEVDQHLYRRAIDLLAERRQEAQAVSYRVG